MDVEKLLQMMREIEDGDRLHAPSYLKREIFEAIERGEENQRRGRGKRRFEFIGYSVEVGLVTAAAVAFVFLVPFHRLSGFGTGFDREKYAEKREEISVTVSDFTKKIVTFGNFFSMKEKEINEEDEK